LEDIDEDGNRVDNTYDVFGRIVREFDPDPDGTKDIRKSYDDAGRLLSIQDLATGVSTLYTYDLLGRRTAEVVTTPDNAHNRNINYEYDSLGQLVRWADSFTGLHLNTFFDAEGNRVRAFTDSGYDPLGQNLDVDGNLLNPNYRYVDHVYTFDGARRVTQEVQRTLDAGGVASDALISAFGYDRANNRITWNNAGTVVSYLYDANARAVQGDFVAGGNAQRQAWTYDAMGNVLSFRTFENEVQKSATVTQYNDANRSVSSDKDGQVTTQAYDRSLRITQTVLRQSGKTYYYNHSYFGDGREKSIVAFGDAFGNSTSTYDANKIRSSVNLGQGDGQDRPEVKSFVADNEGHLLFQFHDDGKSGTNELREYLYANANPVGESGNGVDGVRQVLLDTGNYSLIQNLGDTFPGGVLTYTTRDGDTLQGIASQMYGNASLWFVIAEANGLNAGESLKAGRTLIIPNSVKTGHITGDNHRVYSESEIVGSTLPNLKTPPPPKPKKGCASIIMIIIIVVIAVVAAMFVGPLAGVLLQAALGATAAAAAGFVATAVAYAIAGAIVAAVASIVQQGLFIALGYQEKFSWKEVGSAAVAGALAGAAQGVGAAAKAAAAAGQLSAAGAQWAQISSAALKAASAASKQLLSGGKITSWTSLAAAAVGGYLEAGQSVAAGEGTYAKLAGDDIGVKAALDTASDLQQISTYVNYATPWVQLAETYVRSDGKLTPTDWANAVGSTLSSAVTDTKASSLTNAFNRLGANLLVGGVLSHYDKDAAQSYLENAVGQEAGQFIGGMIGQQIRPYLPKEKGLVYDPARDTFIDQETDLAYSKELGAFVDEKGNPVAYVEREPAPVTLASLGLGDTLSDAGPGYGVPTTGTPAPSEDAERMAQVMAGMLAEGAPSRAGAYMIDDTGALILVATGDQERVSEEQVSRASKTATGLRLTPDEAKARVEALQGEARAMLEAVGDDPIKRNQVITAAYAKFILDNPDEFLWAGAAAFASNEVGFALQEAKAAQQGFITRLSDRPAAILQGLAKGNQDVFLDVYPMLKLYQERGLAGIEAAQAGFTAAGSNWLSPDAFKSFELLNEAANAAKVGNLDQAKQLRIDAARSLLHHEQTNVLQDMYDKPEFAEALAFNQRNAETWWGKTIGLRPVELVLGADRPPRSTDVHIKFSSDPNANLGDFENWRRSYVNRVLDGFVKEYDTPRSTVRDDLERLSRRR
jgi:YD repeat-containing protein